jgi:hypothetical protein
MTHAWIIDCVCERVGTFNIADTVTENLSLARRRLRQAVAGTERRTAGKRLSTRIGSAFCSLGKMEWPWYRVGYPSAAGCWFTRPGRAARAAELAARARLRVGALHVREGGSVLERG